MASFPARRRVVVDQGPSAQLPAAVSISRLQPGFSVPGFNHPAPSTADDKEEERGKGKSEWGSRKGEQEVDSG